MRFSSALISVLSLAACIAASPAGPSDTSAHAVYPSADGLPVTDPSLKVINTTTAAAASGPLSQGIVVGDLVFISGQLPVDPRTGALVGFDGNGNITTQTAAVLNNIRGIVEASGSSVGKIITCKVFLKHIEDFEAMNSAYGDFFGHHKPTRLTVAVSALSKNSLIEIEAIARL